MSTEDEETSIRRADWPADRELLRSLRETVFVKEQAVPVEIEWDGRDEDATHVLALREGRPVGCGRLLPDGKIGRMAVLSEERGRGIGRRLLAALVEAAREAGLEEVWLHAQQHAADFYRRAGFTPSGLPFEEAGIPHIAMRRRLLLQPPDSFEGGVTYPQPFADYAVALAHSARRSLCLLSPALDHRVFDRQPLVDALSALARDSRQSEVRILVSDWRPMVQRGHRLLTLARRLPSSVRLQQLTEHPDWKGETLLIRDRSGLLWQPGDGDKRGIWQPDSAAQVRPYLDLFEELWRHSAPHVEFRSTPL